MSQSRIELFAAAAISGIMGHARSDNPPDVIAARALEIAIATDKACEAHEDAAEARYEAEADARRERASDDATGATKPLDEAAELAALEAATRPGA